MQQKLSKVDCIIEVHDARVSLIILQRINVFNKKKWSNFYNFLDPSFGT